MVSLLVNGLQVVCYGGNRARSVVFGCVEARRSMGANMKYMFSENFVIERHACQS